MEMCYDGTLVMPSSYAIMNEEEMTYLEGGGTLTVTLKKSTIQTAIGTIVGSVTGVAITTALDAVALKIAVAIELGTAGTGSLAVGAFLIAWHGWAAGISAGIAGSIVGSGASKLYKGGNKTFKITNEYIKTKRISI